MSVHETHLPLPHREEGVYNDDMDERKKPNDQIVKLRFTAVTAALALVGFFLEIGPVGGVFFLVSDGLGIELQTLGFLPYLALAASAALGMHQLDTEPTPKQNATPNPAFQGAGEGDSASEQVRARPDLHQFRMLLTALGGYILLKSLNIVLMSRFNLPNSQLTRALEFGLIFIMLGWLMLWQFMRWVAQRRRWIRLQAELVGMDVHKIVAVLLLIKPLVFAITEIVRPSIEPGPLFATTALLHLAIIIAAGLLWFVRPLTLRRTIIGLLATGAGIVVLTFVRLVIERRLFGG